MLVHSEFDFPLGECEWPGLFEKYGWKVEMISGPSPQDASPQLVVYGVWTLTRDEERPLKITKARVIETGREFVYSQAHDKTQFEELKRLCEVLEGEGFRCREFAVLKP